MRAAVYYGNRDIRIEDVAEPEAGPMEVKVRISYAGICGTDVKDYFVGPLFLPTTPHPVSGAQIPLILGHEFSGTVAEVGAGVSDLAIGERVAIEPIYTCGRCTYCTHGQYNLCEKSYFHGSQTLLGGMADYSVVRSSMVHRLPDGVSSEQGALVEPMAVAMHGIKRAGPVDGAFAVVYGAGPIGLGAFLGLCAEGAANVVVVEPSPIRRRAAEVLGCKHVLDPNAVDVEQAVLSLTNGAGADVSFDVAGASTGLTSALRSTRKRGRVVIIAAHEKPLDFQPNEILMKEISLTSSFAYCDDFQTVISHMSGGHYPIDGWVDCVTIDSLPAAFEDMRNASVNKVLIDMTTN